MATYQGMGPYDQWLVTLPYHPGLTLPAPQ